MLHNVLQKALGTQVVMILMTSVEAMTGISSSAVPILQGETPQILAVRSPKESEMVHLVEPTQKEKKDNQIGRAHV